MSTKDITVRKGRAIRIGQFVTPFPSPPKGWPMDRTLPEGSSGEDAQRIMSERALPFYEAFWKHFRFFATFTLHGKPLVEHVEITETVWVLAEEQPPEKWSMFNTHHVSLQLNPLQLNRVLDAAMKEKGVVWNDLDDIRIVPDASLDDDEESGGQGGTTDGDTKPEEHRAQDLKERLVRQEAKKIKEQVLSSDGKKIRFFII